MILAPNRSIQVIEFLLIVGLTLLFPSLKAEIYPARLQIPMVSHAPVIDGNLNDAVWKECTQVSDFVIWTLSAYITDPVTVYLGYDSENLYIAFKCHDPNTNVLRKDVSEKRLHDTFLWGQNFVRVSLGSETVSLALMADPKGTMTDLKNGDMAWNGNWLYAATINAQDWTSEFKIPFSEFDLDGPPLDEDWSLEVSRSFPKGEDANWSGQCYFSSQSHASYEISRWPDPVPGQNRVTLNIQNHGKNNINIECELELIPFDGKPEFVNQKGQGASSQLQLRLRDQPRRFKYDFTVLVGSRLQEDLAYDLPSEGSYYVTVTCRDDDGQILLRKRGFWFSLKPNRKEMQHLKERLGEGIAALRRQSGPLVNSLRRQAKDIQENLQKMEKNANLFWVEQRWSELTENVKGIRRVVNQYLHQVRWMALQNWQRESTFGLTTAHSVIKLRRDAVFPLPLNDWINISAARNEYESFQLVVIPFGRDLRGLTVQATDLVSETGDRISRDRFEVSLVDYNKINWQAAYVADQGWHPDPLLPLDGPVAIDRTELCRPFWITIYVPEGTPPGEYMGSVSVTASEVNTLSVSIKLRVWDFALPVNSHLKTHTWNRLDNFEHFYNVDEFPLDWYLRFCEVLLKNRMNPGFAGINYLNQSPSPNGEYDFSNVEKILEYCIERGLTRFSIAQLKKGPYEGEEAEKVYGFIEAYIKFLRKKGWLDKALVELWDEPTDLEWPGVKARAKRLRQIDPEIRLQLFAEGGPYSFWEEESAQYGLVDLVDIWAPWSIVESPEMQARGSEIWTYFCTLARGIAPNFYIDRPAIYQRTIPWYCWMYGVDGFEHWSTTYFWRNVHPGRPMSEKWPNVPWDSRTYHSFNGEGQLVYPGPNGKPLPSIRLELFRDGMEDYEYLYKLKEILSKINLHQEDVSKASSLLNIEEYLLIKYPRDIKSTLEGTIRYPNQPERFLEARNDIAQAIEMLQEESKKTK